MVCSLRPLPLCGEVTESHLISCSKSLNKLSILSGVTQSTLNNIMSGRNHSATVSTVKKLCDGLNISVDEFFCSELFHDLEQEIK